MSEEITKHLQDWRNGDDSALEDILPVIYDELYKAARRFRARESGEHTLQTTEIINETYLKLVKQKGNDWQSRKHFFAVASIVMRHFLVDYARTKKYQKRGNGLEKISLDDNMNFSREPDGRILALDEALTNLAKFDERKSRIVEMRYFGGLSSSEVAEVLAVSEITIKREWLKAKAWLYEELASV